MIAFTPYINKKRTLDFFDKFNLPIMSGNSSKIETPEEFHEENFVANKLPVLDQDRQEEIIVPQQEQTRTNSKRYKKGEESAFITELTNAYTKALQSRGLNTSFAKALAVQDALESNYGRSYAGNWNYGNIIVPEKYKDQISWTAGGDKDARGNAITQRFRNYDSLNDFINRKLNLRVVKNAMANTDISAFYDALQSGGYATSSKYADSLKKLYTQWTKHGGKIEGAYQRQYNLSYNPFNYARTDTTDI